MSHAGCTHTSLASAVCGDAYRCSGAFIVDEVLRKRHVSAVIGWVALAWLAPGIGSLLYLTFGINRIHRNTVALDLRAAWGNDTLAKQQQRVEAGIPDAAVLRSQIEQGMPRLSTDCSA